MSLGFLNIEGRKDLIRDTNSGAILSQNKEALLAYRQRNEEKDQIKNLKEQQNTLQHEMCEIKSMLQTLLSRGNN
jgi:hypothetical protein